MNKMINDMRKYKFRLQMFAEDDDKPKEDDKPKGDDKPKEDDKPKGDDKPKDGDKPKGDDKPRTYNDADVDRIVAKHKAEWEKKHAQDVEDAKKEAEKLAKMNKEQKEQYEQEKKDKLIEKQKEEIAKLKAEANRAELSKTAAKIMKEEHQITATQDMLDFVVTDNADDTKSNIDKLVGIIMEDRKAQEEKRARGNTPKNYNQNGGGEQLTEIQRRVAKYKK